ncbi:uncharacterized protein LOC119865721 [Canis lupus familiaris]|uniref:uncharacterized protein LOC119865721 n=1 Tax=Canis lupus familiaris TaxID=9615 RepID=UPI0018F7E42A|nr:uncharacterized protein LOC119865721 [Canis lupus familiaris]
MLSLSGKRGSPTRRWAIKWQRISGCRGMRTHTPQPQDFLPARGALLTRPRGPRGAESCASEPGSDPSVSSGLLRPRGASPSVRTSSLGPRKPVPCGGFSSSWRSPPCHPCGLGRPGTPANSGCRCTDRSSAWSPGAAQTQSSARAGGDACANLALPPRPEAFLEEGRQDGTGAPPRQQAASAPLSSSPSRKEAGGRPALTLLDCVDADISPGAWENREGTSSSSRKLHSPQPHPRVWLGVTFSKQHRPLGEPAPGRAPCCKCGLQPARRGVGQQSRPVPCVWARGHRARHPTHPLAPRPSCPECPLLNCPQGDADQL